jgi:adenosine deaminase
VSKELWLCHKEMGFNARDIKQLITSGFKSAFLPFHEKQQMLRKVNEELKSFTDDALEGPSVALAAPHAQA